MKMEQGTYRVKAGLAEMLKGGVIMGVISTEQAKIAEEAGTCAGMILLAKEIVDSDQPRLGLMDITVKRNAFGRQRESFEADLQVPEFGPELLWAVFIRAPYVQTAGPEEQILAEVNGKIVIAR